MDTVERAKSALTEPELSDLEQDNIRFAELTADLEAVCAELKSANQAIGDCYQRLREIEAHRDAVGRKRDRVLEQFADARESLRKKGVFCG